jgi:hypothetical protein
MNYHAYHACLSFEDDGHRGHDEVAREGVSDFGQVFALLKVTTFRRIRLMIAQ